MGWPPSPLSSLFRSGRIEGRHLVADSKGAASSARIVGAYLSRLAGMEGNMELDKLSAARVYRIGEAPSA